MRRQAFVATLALAAAANAQLNAEAPATLIDDGAGGVAYYTANVLVGGAPAPPFALSFRQDAASTLAWGTPLNSTHVRNTITSPREQWSGAFALAEAGIQTLAFAQLAGARIAWCDGVVYTGKQPPATCTSPSAVHARCTPANGCAYPATVDNDGNRGVLARADPHMPTSDAECTLHLTLANGHRVCAAEDAAFNPAEAGAAIVQEGAFQSLYFSRRADDGPAGAVFSIAIILCLVVWVRNSATFADTSNSTQAVGIAWGVSDLSVTAASASVFAVATAGTAYVPPEIEQTLGGGSTQWFAVYLATSLGAAALATAAALRRSGIENGDVLARVVRATLEVQLMAVLHFHLPITMGLAMRRTIGAFVGVASIVILGRDVPAAVLGTPPAAGVMLTAWTALAATHSVVILLLPTIAQSAGIADKAALEFAVALAAAAAMWAVVRLSDTQAQ